MRITGRCQVVAISLVLSACAGLFGATADPIPTDIWGSPVSWDGVATAHPVRVARLSYAEPVLATDIREGEAYKGIESFDMHTLSVYRAELAGSLADGRPVVFFVHGGSWIDGYAAWYDFVAQSFTGNEGWVTVVVDYRLTSNEVFVADEHCPDRTTCAEPEHQAARTKSAWYDDNLADVALALRWTTENIIEHGGDPSRIIVMGHSAGAHLASLLVTHPDYVALSSRALGVISISGAYDLKMLHKPTFGLALEQTFHGGATDNDIELDEASPITYVIDSSTLPPFFLIHAQQELPSLNAQTLAFRDHLQSHDLACDYAYLTGYSHESEMAALADPDEEPTILVTSWIKARLADARPHHGWIPYLRK